MKSQTKAGYAAAAASLALAAFPSTALAQNVQDDDESIVVTGQRQAYRGDVPLQDLPQNIQVIDSELLEDVGVTRLDEALDLASGVARQNNFGGLWDAFAVRGFSGDENFPSGVLVNGFNAGRGFGGTRDASNIERIEILKGPTSALFGRGEPGGTVNIVTRQPEFDMSGSFATSAGSWNTYRLEGDLTGPLSESIAARVNGSYEQGESYRDTIETESYTLTPSLLVAFSSSTSLSYELEVVHQEVPFDRGVVALNNQLGVIPESRFLGEPGDGPMEVDVLGHQLQLQHDLNDDWSVLFGLASRSTAFEGFSSEAELAASRQLLFTTGQFLSRQRRFRDYETDQTVVRGELSGTFETGPFTHHVLFGADYYDFESDQVQNRFRPPLVSTNPTLAQANAVDIFNPVYGNLPTPGPFTSTLEVQEAWGVYFQDQIDLSERWKIRIGGRYDDFSQDITNRITSAVSSQADTIFSPQVGVVYEASPALSFYASYGEGFRTNTGLDVNGTPFAPEETTSYEIGANYVSTDGRVDGTISIFTMQKSNILTADPINAGFSLAVGEAESTGVEIDFSGELGAGFTIWANYTYLNAEATEDVLDADFAQLIEAGDPLINIPEHSANLLLFKEMVFGDSTLTLGGGVSYVGERLGQTAADFYLPDYTLVRLTAAYDVSEHVRLSAEVNNALDEEYYPNSYNRLWVRPGAPQNYTVRLGYRF